MKSALLLILGTGFASLGVINVMALNSDAFGRSAPMDSKAGAVQTAAVSDAASKGAECLTLELAQKIAPARLAMQSERNELDKRKAEIEALEAKLQTQLASIESSHKAMQDLTEQLNKSATGDISHLVKMYSTMKPKKAAEIFDKMDPAFAAGFIREIDGARAGLILSEMRVDQSYRVSLLIASRQADWRNATQ